MRVHLELSGGKRTFIRLDDLIDGATDFSPAFEEIADDFLDVNRQRFAKKGPGWPALNRRYLAAKRRKGGGNKVLVASGRLQASLTRRFHRSGVRRIGTDEMFVGTKVPYARWHTKKRPPVKLTPKVKKRWREILQRHLTG